MTNLKIDTSLSKALEAFGHNAETSEVLSISNGLINSTYKVSDSSRSIILQKLNSTVFFNPADIVFNYSQIYNFLKSGHDYKIPAPIKTSEGNDFFADSEKNYWRATQFIFETFTPETANISKDAFDAAFCFGNFTKVLADLNVDLLKVIIPRFHDLEFRYEQFSESLESGSSERKEKAKVEIKQLTDRNKLVDFYKNIKSDPQYKLRVMHHDAKLSNILFDDKTKEVVCPVDLDTTQSGYFFSDLGDMIRSMTCNLSENSTEFDSITIREDFYKEILNGYMLEMKDEFSAKEKKNIHYAGLLMIYMQTLRYMTDYLNGDIYYKIEYPEQNFDRAKNQFVLLQKLEEFLDKEFQFKA